MTNQILDPGVEIARIEEMINSGAMDRMGRSSPGGHKLVTPKNAASIILIRGKPGKEEIVMGKRNRNLKFMPGALVFPGGRVDRADGGIKTIDSLNPSTQQKLLNHMRGKATDRRAHALGVAAIRELAEETGLLIGERTENAPKHQDWRMFADRQMAPDISGLRLMSRAITPPGVHRRFDTWFFVTRLEDHHHVPAEEFEASGELEDLLWITPQEAMGHETREITRVMLVELMNRLSQDSELSPDYPAPFYATRGNKFFRKLM